VAWFLQPEARRLLKFSLLGILAVAVFGFFAFFSGHADRRQYDKIESPSTNYAVVRVFYATDRKASATNEPNNAYSDQRSEDETPSLGTLDVSVPRDHKMGEIERPVSIWKYEFREDPEKHMVLLSVLPKPESQFFDELSVKISSSGRKQAFVFIHGYDVTFAEAARRTAQIAYDLGFDGAPILYSWPSKGQLEEYPADEATRQLPARW
jgi:esterase/lipase superfamily enzyme